MDLKTFISEALVQIQEGVQDAIDKRMASDTNTGAINPQFEPFEEGREGLVEKVHFDVAVTATSGESAGLGGGISVLQLSAEARKSKSKEDSSVSRIQFSVRIIPPLTRIHDRDNKGGRVAYAGEHNDLTASDV
jgi:hypothetical protein